MTLRLICGRGALGDVARWARTSNVIGEAKPREFAAKWLFDQKVVTQGIHVIEQSVEVANANFWRKPADDVAAVAVRSGGRGESGRVATALRAAQPWSRMGRETLAGGPLWRGCKADRRGPALEW